ncbi:transporter substrate-binding domain-containing protein [Mameliella sediminis]|uniref:transporter substrate-binding domain-containing protein n=1 Tax=Mameliella sediminis TaxID=2836866 RepID=UPI001C4704DD|nr:transporter substrate-binding domain-containing protein [Mameliella sediminis]MBV7395009.1 transporter substrate-binding domain-containing protein [Mameliella sediminis]MBY6113712.1 transporter substrate-binding domain-containing protein [Antarctobacter heliothermus]MBY6142940.1 transporter substrate-binding domain-containing protein [Mameliella alba]MCA0953335.1 transporter substrate-binding domain-containing protein [Mameliella alba]
MIPRFRFLALFFLIVLMPLGAAAQTLVFSTVDRPPFAMSTPEHQGFSIDLMRMIGEQIGRDVRFETAPSFAEMLAKVRSGETDGAIANISITSEREIVLDFTQPIFQSGLQIMVAGTAQVSLWQQILTLEVAAYVLLAFGLLFAGGMLMWVFERRMQPYFERPLKESMFPNFWWALNLVVNGGFEERMPRSPFGRVLGVLLVVASLFFVSIFVARITAAMTVTALTSTIDSINDLDRRRVGSVDGSTASLFLQAREVRHAAYPGFAEMIEAFEEGEVEALVYDGPLLQYYLQRNPQSDAYLLQRVFRAEDYGIALPSGSPLREPINQALLKLRETGEYDALVDSWFDEG